MDGLKGTSEVEERWDCELATSYQVREQIKILLAASGGVIASVKALKAIYAVLQSLSPEIFPLDWDALFFSIYSRRLHDELASLILETSEVKEVLWGRGVEPFHHIYFLTEKAKRSLGENVYEFQKKPLYKDFLLWSLLPPKFSIYWSYLLEMRSYEELDEDQKKKIPYLPLLRDELVSNERKRLQKKLGKLCVTLTDLNIKPLKIGNLSSSEDNNLYIFLPFKFGQAQKDRFIKFYESYMHNKYITVRKTNEENALAIQIEPRGIAGIYHYVELSKAEIMMAYERFDIDKEYFSDLLAYYSSPLYQRISRHEACYADYYFIEEHAKKRQRFLDAIPEEVKVGVIDKAKLFLEILYEYYDVAQWRYGHIMKTLSRLAGITQKTPISLLCKAVGLKGYLNNIEVKEQTLISFEFSEEFRSRYRKEFNHGLPSGNLHHIYHFVQPEEALKAIYNNKEEPLLWGGPVVGDY